MHKFITLAVIALGLFQAVSAEVETFEVLIRNSKMNETTPVCLRSSSCDAGCTEIEDESSINFSACGKSLRLTLKDDGPRKAANTIAYSGKASYSCSKGPVFANSVEYYCSIPIMGNMASNNGSSSSTSMSDKSNASSDKSDVTSNKSDADMPDMSDATTSNKPDVSSTSKNAPTSAASCIPGSFGKKRGDGFKGYCCKNSDDCQGACISRKCNGPVNPDGEDNAPASSPTEAMPEKSSDTATRSTASMEPTAAPTCVAGSFGKKKGDGFKNYCCKNSDDCRSSCVSGKCNGNVNPSKPTMESTESGPKEPAADTTTDEMTDSTDAAVDAPPMSAPTCMAGSFGKSKGDGAKGYCCKSSDDCQDACLKGKCKAAR